MNLMKKQTILLENILKIIFNKVYLLFLFLFIITIECYAKERWVIDKNISKISFEVPVLFASDVYGEFKNFHGFVEIDLEKKSNNKAILSVNIESIEMNYIKYRELILGPLFFDLDSHPIGVIDTKKFSYENERELKLDIELTIKGISKIVETKLIVNKLTNDIVQIIGSLEFNRGDFNLGIGKWKNTSILKNKIRINSNIFLIKE